MTDDGQISYLLQSVKSQDLGQKGAKKRRNAFQTGAKIYLREKNILGLRALKITYRRITLYHRHTVITSLRSIVFQVQENTVNISKRNCIVSKGGGLSS